MASEIMASLRDDAEAVAHFRLWWERGGQPITSIGGILARTDDVADFYAAIWETAWAACEAYALTHPAPGGAAGREG